MRAYDIGVLIESGDTVIDPMDQEPRMVESFTKYGQDKGTIHFYDGGIMGLDEITIEDIRLPGEAA